MEITLPPRLSRLPEAFFSGSFLPCTVSQRLISIAACRMHACKTFSPFSPVSCHRRHMPGLELLLKAKRAGEAQDLWSRASRHSSRLRHSILTPGKERQLSAEPHANPCLSAVPLAYNGGQTRSSICLVNSQNSAPKPAPPGLLECEYRAGRFRHTDATLDSSATNPTDSVGRHGDLTDNPSTPYPLAQLAAISRPAGTLNQKPSAVQRGVLLMGTIHDFASWPSSSATPLPLPNTKPATGPVLNLPAITWPVAKPMPASMPPDRQAEAAPNLRCSTRGCVFPAAPGCGGLCRQHGLEESDPTVFSSHQPTRALINRVIYASGTPEGDVIRTREVRELRSMSSDDTED